MKQIITIYIPAPRLERAKGWGEFSYAVSLQNSLIALDHNVDIKFYNDWNKPNSESDVNIVIRGGRAFNPPKAKINILWIISHYSSVTPIEAAQYDWVFVASDTIIDKFKSDISKNASYLPQATDHTRFYPGPPIKDKSHDVLFVGNRRQGKIRKVVEMALEASIDISVYGGKWGELVPAKHIAGKTISNEKLGDYYRSAGVVLNDHWPDMAANGFASNRIYDVLASARPLITDRVNGFPRDLEAFAYFYEDAQSLKACVETALSESAERTEERRVFAADVIKKHSFKNRAMVISDKIQKLSDNKGDHLPISNKKHTYCVVTCMKNEGPYILEWIAHNLAIGVTDFLIFTNDCDDGTADILDKLDDMGIVKHLPNPSQFLDGRSPHGTCLSYAPYHREFSRSDYIVIIDIDEFVTISIGDHTLNAVVNANHSPDVISLSELIYGFGGVDAYEDKLVTEQFHYSNDLRPGKNRARRGVKSIIRNNGKIQKFTNHRPQIKSTYFDDILWVDGSGRKVSPDFIKGNERGFDCRKCYDQAVVNHYTLRSGESTLVKFDRGDAVKQSRLSPGYFRKRNHNRLKINNVEKEIPALRGILSELLKDKKLKLLHDSSVEKYIAKIQKLKTQSEFAELWADIRDVVKRSDPNREQK